MINPAHQPPPTAPTTPGIPLLDILRAAESLGVPTYLLELSEELVIGLGVKKQSTSTIHQFAETVRQLNKTEGLTEITTLAFVSVPFDNRQPSTMVEPLILLRASDLDASIDQAQDQSRMAVQGLQANKLWSSLVTEAMQLDDEPQAPGPLVEDAIPDHDLRKAWSELFHSAKELLNEDFLQKIVLSQEIAASMTGSFTVVRALKRLRNSHPNAHLYLFANQLGASPELIVSKQGAVIQSTPLAGTRRKEEVEELLNSTKDRVEHGFVVEHIVEKLLELHCSVELTDSDLIDLGDLVHIRSRIHATAPDANQNIFDLIEAIAPTPAIAGTPTRRAVEAIQHLEGADRGTYGGLIGVVNSSGDGEFYLGIRGLEMRHPRVYLRSGVGIVADSNEASEFNELQAKLATTFLPLRSMV